MARLGLAITRSGASAVLVRRTRIAWHGRVELMSGESIRDGLERLLAGAPITSAFPPTSVVAIGAGQCQLKQIDGLPAVKRSAMSKVVRENSASFFVRIGLRIVVSDVEQRTDGSSWGAAFDADVIDEVLVAFRRRRIGRPSILPIATAVAPLLVAGAHRLADDGVVLELTTVDSGRIAHIRRVVGDDVCETLGLAPTAAAALDTVGVEFLSAYGAAISPSSGLFRWRPEPNASRARLVERVRVAAAGLLLALTASAALIAPGVRAQRVTTQASADLASARDAQLEAARIDGALRRVSGQLERIQQFQSARGQMTLLLGAITQALPDSTALLTLRVDSLEGSFVALTPRAADILPQLAVVDPMVLPKIVGSVTREMQGAVRVERATVRFRRRRTPTAAPPSRREAK
ncbi:MAG: hypothetical protein ABJF01_12040 [bacterium]